MATAIFREDLDAGYVAVLVEMIAGASSTPGLGPAVSARLGPWFAFAERAVTTTSGPALDSVLPPGDVAYGIVALYLGLEMLTHLDGDRPERSASSPTPRTWPACWRRSPRRRQRGNHDRHHLLGGPSSTPSDRHRDSTSSPEPSATPAPPWPALCSRRAARCAPSPGTPDGPPRRPRSTSARSTSTTTWAWWRRSRGRRRSTTPTGCASPVAPSTTSWPSPTRGRSSTPPSGPGSSGSCT